MSLRQDINVNNLIKLNVIFGLGFFALMVLSQRYTSILLLLLGLPFFGGFFGLAPTNIFAIFYFWRRHRLRALLPVGVYALLVLLGRICIPPVTQFLVEGTPGSPDSFLTEENRTTLEDISDHLLKGSFKEILTFDDKATEITMIAGYSKSELPAGLADQLREFEIEKTFIDHSCSLVVFSHFHSRTWYNYVFSPNDLPQEYYTAPVTVTEVDIEDWSELITIATQGPTATCEELARLAFVPSFVYPRLQGALGEEFFGNIRGYDSQAQITAKEKMLVLAALNQQRQVSSRLVEAPEITLDAPEGLRVGGMRLGESFAITALVRQSIRDGTLVRSDDNIHLRIKDNLSPADSTRIEWIHVGLMDFLYGNLIEKRVHTFTRDFGGGWYFKWS